MNRLALLMFGLAMLLGCCGAGLGADNLLPEGDFEGRAGGPPGEGWAYEQTQGAPARGGVEWTTEARSGERAARLVGAVNAPASPVQPSIYSRPIDASEGLHQLKGWYRAEGQAGYRVYVWLGDFSEAGLTTSARQQARQVIHWPQDNQRTEWTPFEMDINVAPGERQMVVLLQAYDIGAVSYDDVTLHRLDDPMVLRVFPADYGRNKTVPLVRGMPGFFKIQLIGDRPRVETAELLIDLPEGVGGFDAGDGDAPVLYAASWWRVDEYDTVIGERLSRPEGRFFRFRVPVPEITLNRLRPTISHCGVTLWVDPGRLPEEGRLFTRPVVNGVEYQETESRLHVLPALEATRAPERFHAYFAFGTFLGEDVPRPLYDAVYDMIRAMGVTHLLVYGDATGEVATTLPWRTYLMERVRAEGGKLWAQIAPAYAGIYTGHGSPTDGPWATRAIAGGKDHFANDDGYYRNIAPHVDGVFWDWEPYGPEQNPCWDDPATLEAFALRTGRAPADVTTELVQGDLRAEFMEFRMWQLGEFIRLWTAHVRDQRPDLTIAVCQGGGVPIGNKVDYRAYNDIPDIVHLPMIYTSGTVPFTERAAAMAELLPGARIMPMTSTFMLSGSGGHPAKQPRAIYFDYMHIGLEGMYGVSHWPDLDVGMDMEYVWEITRAMSKVARVERFVFDGQRDPADVAVRPLPESEARVPTDQGEMVLLSPQWDRLSRLYSYRHGSDTLVAVSNMSSESPAAVQVRVSGAAGGDWYAYDPVTRAALVPEGRDAWQATDLDRGILFEVPAQTVGMLVITPDRPEHQAPTVTVEADVRARFEQRRLAAQAHGDIAAVKSGELVIDWQDMTGDGNAEIRMASPDQQLGLDMSSGILVSWRVGGRAEDLVHRFDDGGACMDQFWWPPEGRSVSAAEGGYELVSREAGDGRAAVTFRRAFTDQALSGLVLEKTYSIAEAGTAVKVRVQIRNESPDPFIEFSYWSHNRVTLGETPILELSTAEGPLTVGGADQPGDLWAPLAGLPDDQSGLEMTAQGPPAGVLDRPVFSLAEPQGARISVTTEPSLLQVYRWRSGALYTLEWMYQRQRVPAGQGWGTDMQLEYQPPGGP